jgi:hypothetical protein
VPSQAHYRLNTGKEWRSTLPYRCPQKGQSCSFRLRTNPLRSPI